MNFPELCQQLGIEFRSPKTHHHVGENFYGIDCPWCSPGTKKFKLGYNFVGRYCTCWTCGYKPLAESLCRISGKTINELWPLCKSLSGDKVVACLHRAGKYLPPHSTWLHYSPPHSAYLRTRGLDHNDLFNKWGVKAILGAGLLSWRLFIPVLLGGREVSWTTRAIDSRNQPRYVSAKPEEELYPLKSLLYGQDHVRNSAIVVEGPVDAWKVGPGAVATFGTQVTREQILRLSKIPVRVVCFDNEAPAQRAADKLCSMLEAFPGTTYKAVLESGTDPGEADPEEIKELRKKFLGDE